MIANIFSLKGIILPHGPLVILRSVYTHIKMQISWSMW